MTRKSSKGHLLIVEDKASLRRMLEIALRGEGYGVTAVETVAAARDGIGRAPDAVLTDLRLPDGTGLDVVEAARCATPRVPVLVMTGYGSVGSAVEAMKRGAVDFLEKPVELDELFPLVEGLLGGHTDDANVFQPPGDAPAIVGRHPRLRAALRLLERVSPTDTTVLLTGESGTGKELFARAVHALSKRSDGPFVAVNCAAIPESLIENELFGHEKGAFTGASSRQAGRFELARGGTIFLDEIGELKLEVQGKVLRVLEERVFERVGGGRPVAVDARVVAATNRDLATMVDEGTFRQDLYYRLDVFPIELPALRERPSDIPALAHFLIRRITDRLGFEVPVMPQTFLDSIEPLPWPGNIRQLANFLERAVIMCDGTLRPSDVDTLLGVGQTEDDEGERLRQALRETDGDKKAAALKLGISYRSLQRKVREHDLEGFPHYRS
ncbi:MAG: sigma-54 dependent transcriptional regulator [Acidobacteriota bacterium]